MTPTPIPAHCPACGAPLGETGRSVGGHCPACLVGMAMAPVPTGPASPAEAAGAGPFPRLAQGPGERPSDRIGPYKLLQEIAEGGMGSVWMAEQLEPVRRLVALKVVKLGMDTREVIARFEAERQALALMDHPNIAKVLDAGTTAGGRPFFVMELVRGIPITQYCDEHQLPTGKRLSLFMDVCRAIQHAHQQGVIHRDIKPSNILVTLHDGVPVPKVIDFGIAKATAGQQLTDKTLFTAFHQFMGTPAYMSPEQAEMSGLGIDTRSDIYALGVLLYELLTGQTPFAGERLLARGLDEVRRVIREEEPPRPSLRLSTLEAGRQTEVARQRGSEAPRLVGALRGDLDWIVMKCLEKDRRRRYESASGLAADVRRHLEGEPVEAGPPGMGYRAGKWMRRHRVAVAMATAVWLALVGGLAVASWQAWRARQAERQAREEAETARAVLEFLSDDLLRQAGSRAQAERQGKADPNLTVREAVRRAAASVGDRFKDRPEVERRIRRTLVGTFFDLGERAEAVQQCEWVFRYDRERLGPEHPETLISMNNLIVAYQEAGRLDQAMGLAEENFRLMQARLGPQHPATLASMSNLALIYKRSGRLAQALPLLEESFKLMQAKLGPDDPGTLTSMANLASAYRAAGKMDLALPLHEEVHQRTKARLGPEHPQCLQSMLNLAGAYQDAGKLDQALALYEGTLKLLQAKLGPEHPTTLVSMNNLSSAYWEAGKIDRALPLAEETLKLRKTKLGRAHPDTIQSMNHVAMSCYALGRTDRALALYEELLALDLQANSTNAHRSMMTVGLCRLKLQQFAGAEAVLRQCLEVRTQQMPDHWRRHEAESALGEALLGQGKRAEAAPWLVAGYEGLKARAEALRKEGRQARLQEAAGRLAALREAQGDAAGARALREEAKAQP